MRELAKGTPSPKWLREQKQFIMVPYTWSLALAKATHVSTYRVALHLLHLDWQNQGRPIQPANRRSIPVSNMAMEEIGVSARSKSRALAELRKLGLIEVVRAHGKAPRVTLTGTWVRIG